MGRDDYSWFLVRLYRARSVTKLTAGNQRKMGPICIPQSGLILIKQKTLRKDTRPCVIITILYANAVFSLVSSVGPSPLINQLMVHCACIVTISTKLDALSLVHAPVYCNPREWVSNGGNWVILPT